MSIPFNPETDIPSLEGKVILITGGNDGLGKQSAIDLSKHNPAQVWIAGRNAERAQETIAAITSQSPNVTPKFLHLDLTSLSSVQSAAKTFTSAVSRLDILMLNAGIMACPDGLTADGYEIQFGTNHIGHALLFKLLTPLLLQSASEPLQNSPPSDIRVVVLSSWSHNQCPRQGIDFPTLSTTQPHIRTAWRYGQSKLANVLFASQAAKRFPTLTVVSLHPGVVKTDLQNRVEKNLFTRIFNAAILPVVGKTLEDGARNQLWACVGEVKSGEYYVPIGVAGKASTLSRDEELAKRLWEWTERELEKWE